jgi:sulfoxide reductase heme-binding subunit YedZ
LGGRKWQVLHKLTYAVGVLAAIHFLMISKVWWGEALIHAAILGVLLALRLPLPQRRPART